MLVNLTSHVLNIIIENTTVNLETSGTVARVATKEETVGSVEGIPIVKTSFGEVEGIPMEEEGTFYVVSRLVLTASERKDLLAPGQLVRNQEGQPIGCKGLSR